MREVRNVPTVPVGFDYVKALLDIRRQKTYEQIAEYCGYEDRSAVARVISGAIPAHPQGEAIWSLYVELYGSKPPLSTQQASGQY